VNRAAIRSLEETRKGQLEIAQERNEIKANVDIFYLFLKFLPQMYRACCKFSMLLRFLPQMYRACCKFSMLLRMC
jgi:hypothetical protein